MPLRLVHPPQLTLCVVARRKLDAELRAIRAHSTLILELGRDTLDSSQDSSQREFFTREIVDATHDLRDRLDALLAEINRSGICHADP